MTAHSTTGNQLVIVRHGQSKTNKAGIFTGLLDPPLTPQGEEEAIALGHLLNSKHIRFDIAFTSPLQRASKTLELIASVLCAPPDGPGHEASTLENGTRHGEPSPPPPVQVTAALNERDYGELNGQSKAKVAELYGEEQAQLWRRSFEAVPPGGESLEMTCERVGRFYLSDVKPRLLRGEKVLLVSHGNTLRGLVMLLEKLKPEEIKKVELGTSAIRSYTLAEDGSVASRELFVRDGHEGGWV